MFVGVPTSVLTPITLEAITSGTSNVSGLRFRARAIWTEIGVINNIVVTLSRKAEATPATSINTVSNNHALPPERR